MTQQILTFLTVCSILSCGQPKPLTEIEKKDITKDIRQTLDNYYNEISKTGLTAEFKYLDNSADFFWVPPGYSSSISYDSVIAVINKNAPVYKSVNNSFDTLRIIPLSKELAIYTGRLRSTMTDTADKETTLSLMETGVLIKRQDGWKLLNGQTSILNQ
jgi:hypothetical protein